MTGMHKIISRTILMHPRVCHLIGLMHELASRTDLRGGFVHVPPFLDDAPNGMAIDTLKEGLRVAILAALECAGPRGAA